MNPEDLRTFARRLAEERDAAGAARSPDVAAGLRELATCYEAVLEAYGRLGRMEPARSAPGDRSALAYPRPSR